MNKLTIEHIAPYLPYKLMWYQEGFPIVEQKDFNTEADYNRGLKPLLRPLSDLTKEIEHNGENFVPMERILLMVDNYRTHDTIQRYPLEMPYDVVVSLISWHFDVFNLIPQGLAIKTPQ